MAEDKPLSKFEESSNQIIDSDNLRQLAREQDNTDAQELIDQGKFKELAKDLGKYEQLSDDIALYLINHGRPLTVSKSLGSFEGLSNEVFVRLMEEKCIVEHKYYIAMGIDQRIDLALQAIDRLTAKGFVRYIGYFELLSKEVANTLIDQGQAEAVLDNMRTFFGMGKEVLLKLLSTPQAEQIHLAEYTGPFYQDVADALIKKGLTKIVERDVKYFKDLSNNTAHKLLARAGPGVIARNVESFTGLDFEMAQLINPIYVLNGLDHFLPFDHDLLIRGVLYKYDDEEKVKDRGGWEPWQKTMQTFDSLSDQHRGFNQPQDFLPEEILGRVKKMDLDDNSWEMIIKFVLDRDQGFESVTEKLLSAGKDIRSTLTPHLQNLLDKGKLYELIMGLDDIELVSGVVFTEIVAQKERLAAFGKKYQLRENELAGVHSDLDNLEEIEASEKNKKKSKSLVRNELLKIFTREESWVHLDLDVFSELCKTVGDDNAWSYINGPCQDRHQALQFVCDMMEKIPADLTVEIRTSMGRKKKTRVLPELLMQTAADASEDPIQGNSYQRLSSAINNFKPAWLKDQCYFEDGTIVNDRGLRELNNGGIIRYERNTQPGRSPYRLKKTTFNDVYFVEGMKAEELANVKAFRKSVERRRTMNPKMEKSLKRLEEENPRAYEYFQNLIKHPTVDMGAVLEFMEDPERFFQRGDGHASAKLQSELAPVQLTEINDGYNSIALSAEDVRDALIEGHIDQMSSFKPHAQEYELVVSGKEAKQVKERINKILAALDEQGFDFVISAQEKGNSFLNKSEKNELVRRVELYRFTKMIDQESLKQYMQDNLETILSGGRIKDRDELEALAEEAQARPQTMRQFWSDVLSVKGFKAGFLERKGHIKLAQGVQSLGFENLSDTEKQGFMDQYRAELLSQQQQDQGDKLILRAEVLAHSDPRLATKGDDTAGTCDPFGSGKNNIYMMYPQCGAFVISFRGQGQPISEASIAIQSTLTENQSIASQLGSGSGDYDSRSDYIDLIKDPTKAFPGSDDPLRDLAERQKAILALDNLEGHAGRIGLLMKNDHNIIETICEQFFEEYREVNPTFENSQVVIGSQYSKYGLRFEKIDNKTIPKAAISYSDNLDKKTLQLLPDNRVDVKMAKKGVQPITWRDTLAVSMIERSAYTDRSYLAEGTLDIQKILTASEIASQRDGSTNLNFGYRDGDGVLRGYLLGYLAKEKPEYSWDDEEETKDLIYFHDLAVADAEKNKTAGGRLIIEAFKAIQADEKLRGRDIIMRARESTSYPILSKHAEKYGYLIVDDEQVDEEGVAWHRLRLEPTENAQQIAQAA